MTPVAQQVGARIRQASQLSFVRNVAMLAGGGSIAQAVPLLLTPVLTRLYSPSDMGLLGLYLAFIGFLSTGTTLGFSMAIVSARDDTEAADLATLSALVSIPISILGAGLLLFMTYQDWLGFGELPPAVSVVMAISLMLTSGYITMRYWLIRKGAYRAISAATVGQSIGRVATQVLAGIASLGWPGLVGGEVVGRGAGLRQMALASMPEVRRLSFPINGARLRATAMVYRKFPLYTAPSSLVNSLALSLPVPLISGTFGVDAAGQFAIASRVLLLPLALVGASIGDVFHNRISDLYLNAPARALPFFYKVSGALLIIGAVPMLVVALLGERLWPAILGKEWSQAGVVAAVITPWALTQFVVSPVSRIVAVYQGQEFKLLFDVLALFSVVGVVQYGSTQGWTLETTSAVLGATQALAYGVYFLLLIRILTRHPASGVAGTHMKRGQF